jgi:hypothetical protein
MLNVEYRPKHKCPSSLSPGPSSPGPTQRQKFEVRKHRKSGPYKSMAYSLTFQAVGWRHCLPGGNHQPAATLWIRPSGVEASAGSIRLIMPCAESWVAASCYAWMCRSRLHPGPLTILFRTISMRAACSIHGSQYLGLWHSVSERETGHRNDTP